MKLTRYISLRFIGIAALIMLLSIPVSYFVIEKIMEKNVDESLRFQKEWLISQMQNEIPENFSKFNQNVAIREVKKLLRANDAYNNKTIYVENDGEFVNHRVLDFYKKINGKIYHFKIRKSLVENEDILKSIALLQFSIFAVLIGALLLINQNVENKIWKPFYKMLSSLKQYRVDHHNLDLPENFPVSEMNDLKESLTDLTERNSQLYKAQKEFTENASHELQTPLAIIRNKLEMLMQTEPLSQQQMQYIGDLYTASQKISKLNKSLLLLTKIENRQFEQNQEISIKELITKTVEDFQYIFQEKEILFSANYKAEKWVNTNETLMQILVGNLISNAVKYAPQQGFVKLKLTENHFEISNSATGNSLNTEYLFQRFHPQNNNKDSNGLGLEICRKICEIYGWKLTYSFENQQHYFRITFNN